MTLVAPERHLVSIDTLARYFASGAALAAKSRKYVSLAQTILDEQLGPKRIATVFRLSACKTARADCAFILLAGSVARYRGQPDAWGPEPEATICRSLVGHDFRRVSDEATRFVKQHWLRIEALAHGAVAAA